jgi:TRAP transporter TAXI family solute receptor
MPKQVRLLAASLDGTYTALATSLSEHLGDGPPRVQIAVSSGSVDNLTMLSLGNTELAMVQLDVLRGIGRSAVFRDPLAQVRIVAPLHLEEIHILIRKDGGITSLAQLGEKRLSVGPGASGSYFSAKAILRRAGVDLDDVDLTHRPTRQAIEALLAGETDAVFFTGGQPVPFLAALPASVSETITLLDLGDDPAKGLGGRDLTYLSSRIPAGTYQWVPDAISTVATPCVLIARVDTHPEAIKSLLEAIYSRRSELEKAHPKWAQVSIATAKLLLAEGGHPFHEGAVEFLSAR